MSDASQTGPDRAFERIASTCAILVGIGGVAYWVTFVAILRGAGRAIETVNAAFLLGGGLLSMTVLVAIYRRVREASPALALWALLLGVIGAAGPTIHGGFDLARTVKPPPSGASELPANPAWYVWLGLELRHGVRD